MTLVYICAPVVAGYYVMEAPTASAMPTSATATSCARPRPTRVRGSRPAPEETVAEMLDAQTQGPRRRPAWRREAATLCT